MRQPVMAAHLEKPLTVITRSATDLQEPMEMLLAPSKTIFSYISSEITRTSGWASMNCSISAASSACRMRPVGLFG